MSRTYVNCEVLNEDTSDGYSVTSDPTNIRFLDNVGYQVIWTGDLEGTFAVEASNNYNKIHDSGDWFALTIEGMPAAEGYASNGGIPMNQVPYEWVRVSFDATDGSGNVSAVIQAKRL